MTPTFCKEVYQKLTLMNAQAYQDNSRYGISRYVDIYVVVISCASTNSMYMYVLLLSKLPHRGYYLILPPYCNINLWGLIGLLQNHGVCLGVALYKMTGREHGLAHTPNLEHPRCGGLTHAWIPIL